LGSTRDGGEVPAQFVAALDWPAKPIDLNTAARLAMIAERCGPQFLDDADSFGRVLGRGSFARLDSKILDVVRRVVESGAHSFEQNGIRLSDPVQHKRERCLKR
jgi:hypothetical protein